MKHSFSNKKLSEFGIFIGFMFPVLIGFIIPLLFGHSFRTWTLFIGMPLFILGFIRPELLLYPYKAWMKLGHILGWVNSRIILGLVFILVLQPIAFVMKIFGYDPLRTKKNNQKTYRENKNVESINITRIF